MPDHCIHAVVGIRLQQPLALEAPTDPLTDQSDEILQFCPAWCSDAFGFR